MAHIDWAREASAVVIAPATANILNKLAHGFADDMLTTIVLAFEGPLVIAPAMNPSMYSSEVVQSSLQILRSRAASIVEPVEGDVACGESGQGKLASTQRIVDVVQSIATRSQVLRDEKVLITSGPTRESLDAVRFLSNRSSGKMGSALARAALLLGAEVTIVSGPVSVSYPSQAKVIFVESAVQMLEAATNYAKEADWILGAAAVSDFRGEQVSDEKLDRKSGSIDLRLIANPDVIAGLAKIAKTGAQVVGFAAELGTSIQKARTKLHEKALTAIAHNNVKEEGVGFDSEDNSLTLILADGDPQKSGKQSKLECALWLFESLHNRSSSSQS